MRGPVAADCTRPATQDDLAELIRLEAASFSADTLSARSWRDALAYPRALVRVIAGPGSDLVGAGLVFTRAETRAGRLYSLAIAPPARGQGWSSRLLTALEDAARQAGCAQMRLEVREDNVSALALYQKHGYSRLCRRPGYYADGVAALRFAKPL